jgi:preprotein translocase subunit SecD
MRGPNGLPTSPTPTSERNLAIVLDGVVQSAPVIRSRIPDGHAVIEGQFTSEDAKFLKAVLQAGALPAPLEIVEERTVGATLGDDSIKAGVSKRAPSGWA